MLVVFPWNAKVCVHRLWVENSLLNEFSWGFQIAGSVRLDLLFGTSAV